MMRNPNYNYCQKLPPQPIIEEFIETPEEVEAFTFAINQTEFINANSFCQQVGILCNYLKNGSIDVSYGRIAALFGKGRITIYDQNKNYHIRTSTNSSKL